MHKPISRFESDAEAERFVATADLAEVDLSGFRPTSFEFASKNAQLNMRLPEALLDAVKAEAATRNIPYTRLIRQTLEAMLHAGKGQDVR